MIFSMLRYEIPDPQQLIEIMIYESQRIFKDRLVDKESKKRFDQILYTLLKNHLKFGERLVDTYYISKVAAGDSLIKGLPNLGRITKTDFVQLVDQQMRAYEREFKELDIHLIDEVLDLFAYVERTLSQQGGCLLLAGRAGVGRKQATQLISHMLNAEFFSPNINRDYAMKEFKRDIKKALEMAGVQGNKTVFYVEDHQILRDEFLTYINSLISSGEIPGLYTPEELEPVLNQLKDEMASQYEARTLFEFFVLRVKKNLSVVLSLDNQHPKFQQHCSQNPALFTRCTILWSDGWSKESMTVVAKTELKEVTQHLDKTHD
jgi:dynein heavy chain 2